MCVSANARAAGCWKVYAVRWAWGLPVVWKERRFAPACAVASSVDPLSEGQIATPAQPSAPAHAPAR